LARRSRYCRFLFLAPIFKRQGSRAHCERLDGDSSYQRFSPRVIEASGAKCLRSGSQIHTELRPNSRTEHDLSMGPEGLLWTPDPRENISQRARDLRLRWGLRSRYALQRPRLGCAIDWRSHAGGTLHKQGLDGTNRRLGIDVLRARWLVPG